MQQVVAEQMCAIAEHQTDDGDDAHAAHKRLVDAVVILCAEVLSGEADGSLVERVHRDVHEAFDVGGSRVACNRYRAEAVDRGLDEHVRDVEDDALHTGRQADLHNLDEFIHAEVQAAQVEMAHAVRLDETQHGQRRRNALAEHGSDRGSGHAHAEQAYEQQVAEDVHHACRHQEVQRTPGIAYGTQHSRAEVVDHGGRHTDEVHLHVQHSLIDNLVRRGHQRQHGTREYDAEHDQYRAANQAGEQSRLDGLLDTVVIPLAVVPRDKHVRADRDTDERVDQQVEQRGGRADRRHRIAARKFADYDNIGRVEQQLQHARKDQRQRKQQDFAQQRTAAQIHLVAAFHSMKHFLSFVKFAYYLYYLSEFRWCQWVIVFPIHSCYSRATVE